MIACRDSSCSSVVEIFSSSTAVSGGCEEGDRNRKFGAEEQGKVRHAHPGEERMSRWKAGETVTEDTIAGLSADVPIDHYGSFINTWPRPPTAYLAIMLRSG